MMSPIEVELPDVKEIKNQSEEAVSFGASGLLHEKMASFKKRDDCS